MVIKNTKYHLNNPVQESNMAIIVTSHQGHLMFMKYALEKYMESGKHVICSYDSHGTLDVPPNIFQIPHSWAFKHKTYGAGKRNGWLWDIVYGAGIVNQFSNFEYVFTTNSDCVWDNPKAIDDIIKMLGDYDLMSSSSNGTIHTCNVIWKRKCFLDFVSLIRDKLNENIPPSYSPEVLLRDFAKRYRNKTVPIQPRFPDNHFYEGKVDHYSSYHQDSTWKNILGYRNLGGEHKWSCLEHLEPVPSKYFDLRNIGLFLSQHEKTTLYNYYTTNDRRWLYMYWDQGEDSWYNRKYFDLEYYGKEPLKDDSKRKELGPDSERKGIFDRFDLDFINKE